MNINLNSLRIFHTVANSTNFTEAAKKLYISQPAVSTQIRKMEKDLGIDLIEIHQRSITLTKSGEILYKYAEKIFSLVEDAENALTNMQELKTGSITISASYTPGTYFLPTIIADFSKTYPGINLLVEISSASIVKKRILSRDASIAIIANTPEEERHEKLENIPLIEDRLVIVTSPKEKGVQKMTLSYLEKKPFIMREVGSNTRQFVEMYFKKNNISPKIVMEIMGHEAVKRAVRENLGFSILPSLAVEWETNAGYLKKEDLPGSSVKRYLSLIYLKQKPLTKIERVFISTLNNYVYK